MNRATVRQRVGRLPRPILWVTAGMLVIASVVVVGERLAGPNVSADLPAGAAPQATRAFSIPPSSAAGVTHSPPAVVREKAPVRICGASTLQGPSTPPIGAVVVRPSQNLDTVTQARPERTTFWLAPGVHHLGRGEFDQIQPKTGSRYIGAPGAVIDGRRVNRYAFTGTATDVHLEHFTVQNFGARGDNPGEGVVNHDGGTGWVIAHMTIQSNAGAGVRLSDGNVVRSNCLRDNGEYGFNAYSEDGVRNIVLSGNEISGNNTDDWEKRQPGCGCTGGGKFWDSRNVVVIDNFVHDNHGVGLWADTNNAGFLIRGNYISANDAEGLVYEISYNAAVVANTFVANGRASWQTNPGFPTGAIYLSEAGSDSRVNTAYRSSFEVAHNAFIDNWGGVVAWENADRFAGSPNNSSSEYGTLVTPGVTVARCQDPDLVRTMPYFSDCRWKTQNVKVHDNVFSFTPSRLGADCTPENLCGYNGLFSNFGSSPDWSPYHGTVIERSITFSQGNMWSKNTYVGPWRFMVLEQGNTVSSETWRGPPYNQDAGSTLR